LFIVGAVLKDSPCERRCWLSGKCTKVSKGEGRSYQHLL